jgi:hypothetical protein
MKPRSTLTLVTLAALMFGFIWLYERHQRPAGLAPPLERALTGLRPAAVTRVQVRPAGRPESVVERTNNVWLLTRPVLYPAVGEAIENLLTGLVEITSQNHNYALSPEKLPSQLELTHINLNDQTVEGIRHKSEPAFAVQYHPEAAPGPNDAFYLFKQFRSLLEGAK